MLDILQRWKLLKPGAALAGPGALARLCAEGTLEGGLSVALDVRPDELFGPLASALGGRARGLKVLDVRDRPGLVIQVAHPGGEATWKVKDLPALVERLNGFVADDRESKVAAVLGEWEDALQIWCLPRPAAAALMAEREFQPLNRRTLAKVLKAAATA